MAYLQHEAFEQPRDPNSSVWRYIDFAKLVHFLDSQSLFFAPIQTLGETDQFEGELPMPMHAEEIESWKKIGQQLASLGTVGSDPKSIDRFGDFCRECTCVNCWCLQHHESAALWRIYGFPTGIALKSTYDRLARCLPDECFLGLVQYIDYKTDEFRAAKYNLLSRVMHKRPEYEFEQEVRAVAPFLSPYDDSILTDSNRFHREHIGLFTQVDICDLVESIVISPFAPHWFTKCVESVLHRFGLKIPVVSSTLTELPPRLNAISQLK